MRYPNSAGLALVCVLSLAAFTGSAQSPTNNPAPLAAVKTAPTPAFKAQSFDAFKSVPDRNIFNSRRYAGRSNETPPPITRRDPVIESFSLLGTLDYPKGSVAFFEGSSDSHRKAAKLDESIGGCKITGIEPNIVTLEANGKPIELKVGYMLRREDEGAWQMREAERQSDYSSGSSSSFGSGSSFGGSSSSRDSRTGSSNFSSSRDSGNSSRTSRGGSSSSSSFNRDPRSNSGSSFGGGSNPAEQAQQRMRDQDRNGDGKISRDEADSRLRPNFDLMDRNRDGMIDSEEYTAYYVTRGGGSSSGNTFNSGGNSSSSGTFGGGSTSGSSSAPPASAPTSGGGNESDLLKRLMEQRSRENR